MIYWIAYLLTKFVSQIFFPCTFIGKEHLPKKGSFIIASNHLSYLDPQILGISCWRKFGYIAKDSLFKNKFFSFWLHQVGAFPIKRDASDFRAIREALKRLKNGYPIILFPEGTRGTADRQKKPQAGVGFIAVKSGVPVIPAYINGSDRVLPHGAKWFKRHPVTVKLGKPLHFSKDQSYPEIASQIMEEIFFLSQSTRGLP